jgi:PGF-CTERM protein
MTNVSLQAEFSSGLLQLQVQNGSYEGKGTELLYELEGLGADNTTQIRVTVTVANFTPRVLIGSANDVNWTRTRTADGDWTISITGSPAEVHSYFEGGTGPDDWNGSLTATESQNQTITYAVDGLSTVSTQYRERLNGSVFITDAQEFGVPQYNATATPDRVELDVAAPHFETDGETVNKGFFKAKLSPSLLDEWGVTAADLVGRFNGTQRATTVSATPDGGARVSFDITYSEGTAAVTYNESGPTEPSMVAPPNRTYNSTNPLTIRTDHNATGVIDSDDVAIRLVNVTADNDTVVAVNDSVPVAGEVNTTIPAAELSGDVTIETQLYNNSSDPQVEATDTVTLFAAERTDGDSDDPTEPDDNDTPDGDTGGGDAASFGETTTLGPNQLGSASLSGKIRAETGTANNLTVGLLRSSEFNYSLAITSSNNATNVTFYLQTTAISNSQDIDNLTMYLNGEQRNFTTSESDGKSWVVFTIPHFSTQVVTFTSGVELSDASVSANDIKTDEEVTVNATLENTGENETTVALNLTDNGSVIDTKEYTVKSGESQPVQFTRTLNPGEYELEISGLSAGTVNVTESESPPPEEDEDEETSSQAPGFGPVVTLAALLSAAVLALRRRGS